MDRDMVLKNIYKKKKLIKNFDYDAMTNIPLCNFISKQDIFILHKLVTSAKYSGMAKEDKFKYMDNILEPRGFKRYHAGTNRIVYKNEYNDSFLIKVAIDDIGLSDNKYEYLNQQLMKPFVTKVFEVTQCGTVEMVERVHPITNRYEFSNIAEEVFFILENNFIGKYVLEDIGTDFFMNWGVRDGFGAVLLDFPYLYKVDGEKLKCTKINRNGIQCNGYIDYDNGLNTLVCEKCGHRYAAKDLGKANGAISATDLIIKGVSTMEFQFKVSTIVNGVKYKHYKESDIAPSKSQFKKKAFIDDAKKKEFLKYQTDEYNNCNKNRTIFEPDHVVRNNENTNVNTEKYNSPDKNHRIFVPDDKIKDAEELAKNALNNENSRIIPNRQEVTNNLVNSINEISDKQVTTEIVSSAINGEIHVPDKKEEETEKAEELAKNYYREQYRYMENSSSVVSNKSSKKHVRDEF